jgi:hypothetical protein
MMRISFLLSILLFSFVCTAQQLKEADVPANVKDVALKQSNNQTITMWVLDKKRSKYIASVISNSAVMGIEISLDGKWIETTAGVFPDKMPAGVMKAAQDGFPGYELDNYFYVTAPDKSPYYTIDASSDDADLTLSIDPNGKLLGKKER